MNPSFTQPLPVPMAKETTVKEDGRFLYYYTFEDNEIKNANKTLKEGAQPHV